MSAFLGSMKRVGYKYPSLGPWLFILSIFQWFLVQYVAAIAWPTGFSLHSNLISDLGNTACGFQQEGYICSPLHSLLNITLVFVGLALGFGAQLIFAQFRRTRARTISIALLCISGFGTSAVGLVPENLWPLLHVLIAGFCLACFALGVSSVYWLPDVSTVWRQYSLICGIVASIALLGYAFEANTPLGLGGIERLADYTLDVWIITFGFYMLKRSSSQPK